MPSRAGFAVPALVIPVVLLLFGGSAATITVTPGSATIVTPGGTQQFTALVQDAGGTPLPGVPVSRQFAAVVQDANGISLPGVPLAWTSSDTTVATVDPATGLVTAVRNGTATITPSTGTATGAATVVVAQLSATVTVRPDSATLFGFSRIVEFVAEARDANGQLLSGVVFTWTSSRGHHRGAQRAHGPQGIRPGCYYRNHGGSQRDAVAVVVPPRPEPAGP